MYLLLKQIEIGKQNEFKLFFRPSDDEELNEVLNETVGHSKDLTLEEALQVVETLKRKSHENLLDALKLESQIQYEKMNKPPEEEEESEAGKCKKYSVKKGGLGTFTYS